jgi:hypothetical protein
MISSPLSPLITDPALAVSRLSNDPKVAGEKHTDAKSNISLFMMGITGLLGNLPVLSTGKSALRH